MRTLLSGEPSWPDERRSRWGTYAGCLLPYGASMSHGMMNPLRGDCLLINSL